MKHRVRILRRAQGDLEEIARYLGRESPAAAERLVELLLSTIEALDELPDRGALPRDERLRELGFRFLLAGGYLIFYKPLRSQVRVYRVLHGRRAYARLL